MKHYIIPLAVLLIALGSATNVGAQETQSADDTVTARPDTWRHFENLVATINAARQDLHALRKQMQQTDDEAERERMRGEVARLSKEIDSLQVAWEMWATGGVDIQLFTSKAEEKFDWREEIESVFEPIVVELRRLTERPRKIERLRSEQAFYQQRLAAAEAALKNVVDYKANAPTPDLVHAFDDLASRWRKRRDDLRNRFELVSFELTELLAPSKPAEAKAGEALQELLSGRLLNLLLAVLAAALTYGLLWLLNRFYTQMMLRRGRKRPFFARVLHLIFIVVAALLALFAAMAVLYARGDWILLGLLLIILVGAALTLQRSLPGYLKEARVLLNIGPVREGERVIYNGLPWKVQALNMYSTLINPTLRSGRLLLPLSELTTLVSRRYDDNEPWFPTREDDFVLLSDNTYGRVVLQSPETVQLRVAGALRNYRIGAFLDSNPQNLSLEGFAVIIKFGLDYRHQAQVTSEIREQLADYIGSHLKAHVWGKHLQDFMVEFDQAAVSSLDFFVWATFSGEAADSYRRIQRLMQGLAVDACNAHGWEIPFTQMTVHLANEEMKNKSG